LSFCFNKLNDQTVEKNKEFKHIYFNVFLCGKTHVSYIFHIKKPSVLLPGVKYPFQIGFHSICLIYISYIKVTINWWLLKKWNPLLNGMKLQIQHYNYLTISCSWSFLSKYRRLEIKLRLDHQILDFPQSRRKNVDTSFESFLHFTTYVLQIMNSERRLFENK
jgi:hypothetical protein